MTQVKKRKKPTTLADIPVVPVSKLRAQLRRRIRRYEQRTVMRHGRLALVGANRGDGGRDR